MSYSKKSSNQQFGVKIGNVVGQATRSIVHFVIDPDQYYKDPIRIGEFVAVKFSKPDDVYLASITNILSFNEYLLDKFSTDPDIVDRIVQSFNSKANFIGELRLLGKYDDASKSMILPRHPPIPGDKVYRYPTPILTKIFSQGTIEVGSLLSNENVRVSLNLNNLISRHFAILAITGAGKSNTVAVILKQLLLKYFPSIVVIDPHEEYVSLMKDKEIGKMVKVFSPTKRPGVTQLRFKLSNFNDDQLIEMLGIPSNATLQIDLFKDQYAKLKKAKEQQEQPFGIEDLEKQFELILHDEEQKKLHSQARGLLARLRTSALKQFIDAKIETPLSGNNVGLTKKGQLTIITTGLLSARIRDAMIRQLLTRIFNGAMRYRRGEEGEKTEGPVLIILEEAHNFAPSEGYSKSLEIIAKIASEGRKFGVGLGVVTQRPGRISANLLSQCNTQIIMRIVNPRDQKQIENSAEAISADLLADLPAFNKGEAVIIGPSIPIPAIVKIDKFQGELGGSDIPIEEEWSKEKARVVDEFRVEDIDEFEYEDEI